MATPDGDRVLMRRATRNGDKEQSTKAKKCQYFVQVFGYGYHGKKMVLRPKHKYDLLSELCHDLDLPEGVPFHLEIYDEEWKEFGEVHDFTRLPDEATLRLRFGGSEEAEGTEEEEEDETENEAEDKAEDKAEDEAEYEAEYEAEEEVEEEDKIESEVEDEEEETGDEEGSSQSSGKSWSAVPNTAGSKKIPRGNGIGRETPPRPEIKNEIPHSPRIRNKRLAPSIPKVILAKEMKDLANLIQPGVDGKPAIYELCKSVVVENKTLGIVKFDIGPRLRTKQEERVLLIVGQTGAGKTTMINGLTNYVYGIEWKDDFRYKIITEKSDVNAYYGANSQTKGISAYSFNWRQGMRIPYTLTVIDTPGFGDSEGLHKDEELVVKMREFFELCEPHGLNTVNAVGFVLPASTARLTASQKYIFHASTQMFGIDTKEKFVLLCSFCDGQEPAAIVVVRNAKLFYQDFHPFNNSALFASNKDRMQKMFWDLGLKSNKNFLASLGEMTPVGLAMTREVLVERRALAENLKKLQEQIPRAASSLTALQEECRLLREKREEVTKVADVAEERVKIPLEKEKAINCNECSRTTCEYPASISKPRDVKHCHCMTRNEQKKMICSKCGCSWRSHSLDAKRYEEKSIFRSKTEENSERVYYQIRTQVNLEKKVLELTTKIKKNQVELFAQIQKAHKTTARLKEIALNPSPLTMEEYIDFLIEAERKGAENGFKNRIAHLEEAKRASVLCKQILDENGSSEAIMPNVMTILEKENIDFEKLGVVETPDAAMHQPNSMVGTLKAFFISILGRNSRKT